jgi:hypothetical protein
MLRTGWTTRVRFPAMQDSSLLHSVRTGSFLWNGYRGLFPRGVNLAPPSSVNVKNDGAIPPLAYTASWHRSKSKVVPVLN